MASFANRRRVVVDGNNIGIANATQVGHLLNGTLFGFCKTIGMLMKKYPDSIIQVAWDSKTCWRNDYYPEYKTTRKNDPDPAKKEFFAKPEKTNKKLEVEGDDFYEDNTLILEEPKKNKSEAKKDKKAAKKAEKKAKGKKK